MTNTKIVEILNNWHEDKRKEAMDICGGYDEHEIRFAATYEELAQQIIEAMKPKSIEELLPVDEKSDDEVGKILYGEQGDVRTIDGWISVEDRLPEIDKERGFSDRVLVKNNNKDCYPWVAHLYHETHIYPSYHPMWYLDDYTGDNRLLWLSPHAGMEENKRIKFWQPLPSPPES